LGGLAFRPFVAVEVDPHRVGCVRVGLGNHCRLRLFRLAGSELFG
jgi:hypothetical protein